MRSKAVKLPVPLVVRLEGTNVDAGKKLIAESGLSLITADDLADAAQKVVKAAGGRQSESNEDCLYRNSGYRHETCAPHFMKVCSV